MSGVWIRAKSYIKALREIIVNLDDGIADDHISEDEWNKIWASLIRITMLGKAKDPGQ